VTSPSFRTTTNERVYITVDERKQKAVEGLLRGRDVTKSATEVNKIENGTLERQARGNANTSKSIT
jgi:hypothetical protein